MYPFYRISVGRKGKKNIARVLNNVTAKKALPSTTISKEVNMKTKSAATAFFLLLALSIFPFLVLF